MATNDSSDPNTITKTITIELTEDMTPSQYAAACRSMATLCNGLVAAITMGCAKERSQAVGAAAPITQGIFAAAVQLESAALQLEGPSRVALGGQQPPPIPRRMN